MATRAGGNVERKRARERKTRGLGATVRSDVVTLALAGAA